MNVTLEFAKKLINSQFPEYADLTVTDVERQGYNNRTYRIGEDMLIRMPKAQYYALKVPKEQELLPELAKHMSVAIPAPIKLANYLRIIFIHFLFTNGLMVVAPIK